MPAGFFGQVHGWMFNSSQPIIDRCRKPFMFFDRIGIESEIDP